MIDRQLLVSPERSPTLGTVTRATDSSFNCEVSFRGREYNCKSAGKNALAVGDSVSFVQIDQTPWVIKSDALYPTRFKRPLTDWAGHHKYNLLLQYLISKGARKNYTFQTGTAQGVVSTNVLSVNCWDGRTRNLPVEYAGVLRPASDFVVGDQVLIYQKTPNEWIAIGNAEPSIISLMTIKYLNAGKDSLWDLPWLTPYGVWVYPNHGVVVGEYYAPEDGLEFYCSVNGAAGLYDLKIPDLPTPIVIDFLANYATLDIPMKGDFFPSPHSICLTISDIKSTGSVGQGLTVSMQAYDGGPDWPFAPEYTHPVGSSVQKELNPVAGTIYLEEILPSHPDGYGGFYWLGFIRITIA